MAAKKKHPTTKKGPPSRSLTIKEQAWEALLKGIGSGLGRSGKPRAGKPPTPPEAPTTRTIAERAEGLSTRQVSSALSSLKAEGLVRSRKVKGAHKRYVFALTGEYLTRDSHHRLSTLDKELRQIVKNHKVGDPAMARKLEDYVDRMLDELPAEADVERAERNCSELIEAAKTAELKKEIYAHLGFRPFYASVNAWYPAG